MTRLPEQGPNGPFGLGVVTLAEVRVADVALRVDEVVRRPVLVAPCVPGRQVVVLDDRVGQVVLPDRILDVRRVLLEGELRRVNADDGEAISPVALLIESDSPPGVLNQSCVPVKSRAGP